MKLFTFLGRGLLGAAAVVVGLGAGEWVQARMHSPPAQRTAIAALGHHATPQPTLPDPATPDSLLHYRFVPGDRFHYALDATISGSGIESLTGPGSVAMEFVSDLSVVTESADLAGNGNLSIAFDRVEMRGSFMDAPVHLVHTIAGTEFVHGNQHLSTANGDSIAGIPQLAFFNTPTKARISPAGEVLKVSGAPGMDKLLSPEAILAGVKFPAGDLDAGAQWTSTFAMPVPGIGAPTTATALNVLEGFQLYRGRYCGVIRQTLRADQVDGGLSIPESALGGEMNFSMPEFSVGGENRIYFDVDNGQLVQADLNLEISLRIGGQLQPMAEMLDLYGKLLNELEGAVPGGPPAEDTLGLGLAIRATLALLME